MIFMIRRYSAMEAPRVPQIAPKRPQHGSKTGQDGPKMARRRLRGGSKGPRNGPRGPQQGPKRVPRGASRGLQERTRNQHGSESLPGPSWARPGSDLGTNLGDKMGPRYHHGPQQRTMLGPEIIDWVTQFGFPGGARKLQPASGTGQSKLAGILPTCCLLQSIH